MKALSVRQPWATLLALGHKRIENRPRRTKFRGWVLIHASRTFEADGFLQATFTCKKAGLDATQVIIVDDDRAPKKTVELYGGIIGAMRIDDSVSESSDPFFVGPWGHVIGAAVKLPFLPLSGQLGFFEAKLPADYAAEVLKAIRTIDPDAGHPDLS